MTDKTSSPSATGGGRLAERVLQGDGLTFAERTAAHALIIRALATDAAPLTAEFSEFIGRLSDLAHSADFWSDKPYGNRLYYGAGSGEYIAGDILQAFLHALKINAAPQAPAVTGKAPSGLTATEQPAGAAPASAPSETRHSELADTLEQRVRIDSYDKDEPGVMVRVSELPEIVAALRTAPSATPLFREVGNLYRTKNGEVHFAQKDDVLDFPIHSSKTIYVKEGE